MIPRVTEAATVEVGRFYLVPCVYVEAESIKWAPVIGPEHTDVEYIRFPHRHYHYDWRFLTSDQAWRIAPHRFQRETGVLDEFAHGNVAREEFEKYRPGIEWRKRKCWRAMPDFPVVHWTVAMSDAFASTRLKPDCRTCPHRGVPLNGLPERDGVVVCPGHGLAWNLKTGAMVPRV